MALVSRNSLLNFIQAYQEYSLLLHFMRYRRLHIHNCGLFRRKPNIHLVNILTDTASGNLMKTHPWPL
jgi:hypothetical protein